LSVRAAEETVVRKFCLVLKCKWKNRKVKIRIKATIKAYRCSQYRADQRFGML
jgi:hypothetical protein